MKMDFEKQSLNKVSTLLQEGMLGNRPPDSLRNSMIPRYMASSIENISPFRMLIKRVNNLIKQIHGETEEPKEEKEASKDPPSQEEESSTNLPVGFNLQRLAKVKPKEAAAKSKKSAFRKHLIKDNLGHSSLKTLEHKESEGMDVFLSHDRKFMVTEELGLFQVLETDEDTQKESFCLRFIDQCKIDQKEEDIGNFFFLPDSSGIVVITTFKIYIFNCFTGKAVHKIDIPWPKIKGKSKNFRSEHSFSCSGSFLDEADFYFKKKSFVSRSWVKQKNPSGYLLCTKFDEIEASFWYIKLKNLKLTPNTGMLEPNRVELIRIHLKAIPKEIMTSEETLIVNGKYIVALSQIRGRGLIETQINLFEFKDLDKLSKQLKKKNSIQLTFSKDVQQLSIKGYSVHPAQTPGSLYMSSAILKYIDQNKLKIVRCLGSTMTVETLFESHSVYKLSGFSLLLNEQFLAVDFGFKLDFFVRDEKNDLVGDNPGLSSGDNDSDGVSEPSFIFLNSQKKSDSAMYKISPTVKMMIINENNNIKAINFDLSQFIDFNVLNINNSQKPVDRFKSITYDNLELKTLRKPLSQAKKENYDPIPFNDYKKIGWVDSEGLLRTKRFLEEYPDDKDSSDDCEYVDECVYISGLHAFFVTVFREGKPTQFLLYDINSDTIEKIQFLEDTLGKEVNNFVNIESCTSDGVIIKGSVEKKKKIFVLTFPEKKIISIDIPDSEKNIEFTYALAGNKFLKWLTYQTSSRFKVEIFQIEGNSISTDSMEIMFPSIIESANNTIITDDFTICYDSNGMVVFNHKTGEALYQENFEGDWISPCNVALSPNHQFFVISNSERLTVYKVNGFMKRDLQMKPSHKSGDNAVYFSDDSRFFVILNEILSLATVYYTESLKEYTTLEVPSLSYCLNYNRLSCHISNEGLLSLNFLDGTSFISSSLEIIPNEFTQNHLLYFKKIDRYLNRLNKKLKQEDLNQLVTLIKKTPDYQLQASYNLTFLFFCLNNSELITTYFERVSLEVLIKDHKILELFYTAYNCSNSKEALLKKFEADASEEVFLVPESTFQWILNQSDLIKDQLDSTLLVKLLINNYGEPFACNLKSDLSTVNDIMYDINDKFSIRPVNYIFEESYKPLLSESNDSVIINQAHYSLVKLDLSNGSLFSRNLFRLLETAPDTDLKQSFKHIIYAKWNNIKWIAVLYAVLYWAMAILAYCYYGFYTDNVPLAIVFCVLLVIFSLIEIKGAISDPKNYFFSFYNFIDITIMVVSFVSVLILVSAGNSERKGYSWLKIAALLLVWARAITWLRVIRQCRYLITMVLEVFIDIIPFFVILLCYTVGFAFVWMIAYRFSDIEEEKNTQPEFYNVFYDTINILFGNSPEKDDGRYRGVRFTIIAFGNVLLSLTLVNFLIAVISGTFERINSDQDLYDVKELLNIIRDFDAILSKMCGSKQRVKKQVVTLKQPFEGDTLEGLGELIKEHNKDLQGAIEMSRAEASTNYLEVRQKITELEGTIKGFDSKYNNIMTKLAKLNGETYKDQEEAEIVELDLTSLDLDDLDLDDIDLSDGNNNGGSDSPPADDDDSDSIPDLDLDEPANPPNNNANNEGGAATAPGTGTNQDDLLDNNDDLDLDD